MTDSIHSTTVLTLAVGAGIVLGVPVTAWVLLSVEWRW
jgi:hypothetical protein